MDANLRNSFESIGCEPGQSPRDLLDCLDAILRNPHDSNRPRALTVLRQLEQDAGEHAVRIAALRACYDPPRGPVDRCGAVNYPVTPDDPRWRIESERLFARGADRAVVAEFCKVLVTTFHNRLRQADRQGRRAFLIKYRDLFAVALQRHGLHMLPASRVALTEWIAESDAAHLDDLLNAARTRRLPALWEQVRAGAAQLQKSHQTSERSMRQAAEAAALADRYFTWHGCFDRFIDGVCRHDFAAVPAFPWSPQGRWGGAVGMALEQAEAAVAGLGEWGTAADHDVWREAALGLSRRALAAPGFAPGRPPRTVLESLLALRAQWPASLGVLPEATAWDEAQRQAHARRDEAVALWLGDLRRRFRDSARSSAELAAHPDLPYLDAALVAPLGRFQDDLAVLASIAVDLDQWWRNGEVDALYDGRLARLGLELERLGSDWGESPGHQSYQERFNAVGTELGLLDRAQAQLRNGDSDSALTILTQCRSPAARVLEHDALQLGFNLRLRLLLKQGALERIAPADLERASPDVRALAAATTRGHTFVEGLRVQHQTLPTAAFQLFAQGILGLIQTQPPPAAVLSDADRAALNELRATLRRELCAHADSILEEVRARTRMFPVLEAGALDVIDRQLRTLEAGLSPYRAAGIAIPEVSGLEDSLLPVRKALQVHRACIAGDWPGAAAELADPALPRYLDHHQRRELQATLSTTRLFSERASDVEWLALYLDSSDVLMHHEQFRNTYLQRLRRTSDGRESQHRAIVERWLPDAAAVAALLACFADVGMVAAIAQVPQPPDEPLVKRLLEQLVQSPHNYHGVVRLWQLLTPQIRARVWSGPQSPVERLAVLVGAEQADVITSLSVAEVQAADLKRRLDALSDTGLVDARTLTLVDVATLIEGRMADLDRQDPWAPDLRALLEQTRRDLGRLPPGVAEARGWGRAVERRIEGILTWDDLAGAWDAFNKPFNAAHGHPGLFVGFHYDAGPWSGFRSLVAAWIESLQRAVPRLDWDLPSAVQSRSWRMLIDDWSYSPEGVIWTTEQGCVPVDPRTLCEIYRRIAAQIDEFALLHAGLLAGAEPPLLMRLKDLRPLSRPAAEIKAQLTNPEIAVEIGTAYQRLVTNPGTH